MTTYTLRNETSIAQQLPISGRPIVAPGMTIEISEQYYLTANVKRSLAQGRFTVINERTVVQTAPKPKVEVEEALPPKKKKRGRKPSKVLLKDEE